MYGFSEDELAASIVLNFEATSEDEYIFDGAVDTHMRGEYAKDMERKYNQLKEVGSPDWIWNTMWAAQSNDAGVTALSFSQDVFVTREVSDPLIYYFDNFGTLTLGNPELDMPRPCARRDKTEPVSWDADKGFWTCLQPNEYDPHFK